MIIYVEANAFIEKWSKVLRICLIQITVPGLVIPFLGYGYFVYFTTASDIDAFYLPFAGWYAFYMQ